MPGTVISAAEWKTKTQAQKNQTIMDVYSMKESKTDWSCFGIYKGKDISNIEKRFTTITSKMEEAIKDGRITEYKISEIDVKNNSFVLFIRK